VEEVAVEVKVVVQVPQDVEVVVVVPQVELSH
jgi:hypothetical protein